MKVLIFTCLKVAEVAAVFLFGYSFWVVSGLVGGLCAPFVISTPSSADKYFFEMATIIITACLVSMAIFLGYPLFTHPLRANWRRADQLSKWIKKV